MARRHDLAGECIYNGLNWRIMKQADTDGTGGPDQQRLMHYSDRWQLLEEDVWDAWTEQTPGDIDRHVQYVWGARYIDDIILRREDRDADGDYDLETDDIARYYLTDAQFTPVAIIDDGAHVIERISYMPYGHARHHRMADLNGDGKTNTADQLLLLGNWSNFGVGDLDRSGAVGTPDLLALYGDWNSTALPAGQISYDSEDNQIGYCGYIFNRETQDYTVRNRHYSPDLGRWLQRDPAGYVDGMGLYEYVRISPLSFLDQLGLWGHDIHETATAKWARLASFQQDAATAIAKADQAVDSGSTSPFHLFGQKYHFNRGWRGTAPSPGAADSRMVLFRRHMTKAIMECNWTRYGNDDPQEAATELGTALHPLQDYVAHGDHGTGNPGKIWVPHNFFSPQCPGTTGGFTCWKYPDDPNLDAAKSTDHGRPTNAVLTRAIVTWYGRPTPQVADFVQYVPGHQRLSYTRELTMDALRDFRSSARPVARRGCKCWKFFSLYLRGL